MTGIWGITPRDSVMAECRLRGAAAHHCLGDALDAVARLRADPVKRVRVAAERAVIILAEARA